MVYSFSTIYLLAQKYTYCRSRLKNTDFYVLLNKVVNNLKIIQHWYYEILNHYY